MTTLNPTSKSEEEHEAPPEDYLELTPRGEVVRPNCSKCEFFGVQEVHFLGPVLTYERVSIWILASWSSSKNLKTPESSHMKFVHIQIGPVTTTEDEAFQILKEKLCNAPMLALPDGPDDFVVYCEHQNKANEVADSLEQERKDYKLRRVLQFSITIHSGLKTKILEAQSEASKDLKAQLNG
ncbi:hypothetical protein Tco_1275192 [Tanacetum coccineum]